MNLISEKTAIPGVFLFVPKTFGDERGFFMQTYQTREYAEAGLDAAFVQDNMSRSCAGTVRGLHYQLENPQAKLVSVLRGRVLDDDRGQFFHTNWTGEGGSTSASTYNA